MYNSFESRIDALVEAIKKERRSSKVLNKKELEAKIAEAYASNNSFIEQNNLKKVDVEVNNG